MNELQRRSMTRPVQNYFARSASDQSRVAAEDRSHGRRPWLWVVETMSAVGAKESFAAARPIALWILKPRPSGLLPNRNDREASALSLRERVAEGRVRAGFAENRIDSSPHPRFAHPLPEGEGTCLTMIPVGQQLPSAVATIFRRYAALIGCASRKIILGRSALGPPHRKNRH